VNACTINNIINQIVQDDLRDVYQTRVEIFLGKTSSKKFRAIHQPQNLHLIKDIVNLGLGIISKKGLSLANSCNSFKLNLGLIAILNRVSKTIKNLS